MHPDSTRFSIGAFLRARPWIWIVLAYGAFMISTISFVVIAIKNREPSVPLQMHGR
jgi:hypothetical protein